MDVTCDEGVVWVAFFDGLGVGAVVVGEVVGGLAIEGLGDMLTPMRVVHEMAGCLVQLRLNNRFFLTYSIFKNYRPRRGFPTKSKLARHAMPLHSNK